MKLCKSPPPRCCSHRFCIGPAPAAPAAAGGKVLHMFLSTSETGLDPAVASDIASLSLLENLFDPLLRYDYLARPLKLRENTTVGMPKVEDGGLTYTFQIRPGIYFTPDPAFKGARREVTAADYVYSLKRLYDPMLKSPWLSLFEGKIAGDQALHDKFSYDTRDRRPEGGRSLHPAHQAVGAGQQFPVLPGHAGHRRGRARSDRGLPGPGRQPPGRQRPVHDRRMEAQRQDRAAGQPRLARRVPRHARRRPRRPGHRQRARGQALAAGRPGRSQDRRGIPGPHAGLSRRRVRLPRAGARIDDRHGDRRRQAQARAGGAGHAAVPLPGDADVLHVDEHGRPAAGRLQQGKGGAAARHFARLQQRRGHQPAEERVRDQGAVAAAAERARLRSGLPQPGAPTIRRWPTPCSTASATSSATPTAFAARRPTCR